MTAIIAPFDRPPTPDVRRLVAHLRADLDAIPDHRDPRGRVYALSCLLAIHVLAAIGDSHGPEDAADFARDHAAWLRGLGILGDRIPSTQTLRRLLRDRDTDRLAELQPLVVRLEAVCAPDADTEAEADMDAQPREACAVDGKTVRASFDAARGVPRTHIVSARLDNGLVVGQTAVTDKSNELTAIRQLLPDLALEGRVMSIDALACQTDIAQTIAEGGGWYLLAVKDNPSDLHANLQRDFAYLDRTGAVAHDRSETVERGHGRLERRTCTLMGGARGLRDELDPDRRWTDLGCAVRYYITNLPLTLGAARNMAALRRIALNFLTILQQYFWPKMSIRRLRKMVARNPARLEPIMAL